MRIHCVSNGYVPTNCQQNKKGNVSFGFWQPAMATIPEHVTPAKINKPIPLGKLIEEKLLSYWNIANHKVRHVNIKGSQDKITRSSFSCYDYDGITAKCQQDLYPDGDLITTIKRYNNGKVYNIEEFIENTNEIV